MTARSASVIAALTTREHGGVASVLTRWDVQDDRVTTTAAQR